MSTEKGEDRLSSTPNDNFFKRIEVYKKAKRMRIGARRIQEGKGFELLFCSGKMRAS